MRKINKRTLLYLAILIGIAVVFTLLIPSIKTANIVFGIGCIAFPYFLRYYPKLVGAEPNDTRGATGFIIIGLINLYFGLFL